MRRRDGGSWEGYIGDVTILISSGWWRLRRRKWTWLGFVSLRRWLGRLMDLPLTLGFIPLLGQNRKRRPSNKKGERKDSSVGGKPLDPGYLMADVPGLPASCVP